MRISTNCARRSAWNDPPAHRGRIHGGMGVPGRGGIMSEVGTMSEESEVRRLRTEVERLRDDRRRTIGFIKSEDWAAMNERRAALIDREVNGELAEHERAELATLQFVAGLIVDLRDEKPREADGSW